MPANLPAKSQAAEAVTKSGSCGTTYKSNSRAGPAFDFPIVVLETTLPARVRYSAADMWSPNC